MGTMMNNNATSGDLYRALQSSNDVPTLGVDKGAGQCTAYIHVPNKCTYRFPLDALGSANLLSVLAIISWKNPGTGERLVMPLLSNSFMAYKELLNLAEIPSGQLNQHMSASGGLVNLVGDLMLAAAMECRGDVLYVPVPDHCPSAVKREFEKWCQSSLEAYKRATNENVLIFKPFDRVQCVSAQFSKLFQDFKRSPVQWEAAHSGAYPYTYKDLMGLYFCGLLRRMFVIKPKVFSLLFLGRNDEEGCNAFIDCVLRKNSMHPYMKNAKDRGFRMVVGCPAYPEWTDSRRRREYSAMLEQAAERAGLYWIQPGIMCFREKRQDKTKNIDVPEIFPEPSAAILPHVTGNRADKPKLNMGVVIYDSGALTNDICIMYYAEDKTYRFNYSTDSFGGARIEQQMLEILKRRLLDKINSEGEDEVFMLDFDMAEDASNELFLRTVKENFYPECRDIEQSVIFHLDGQAHTVRFHVRQLIREALNRKYRKGTENKNEEKSWLDRAREFKKNAITRFQAETGLHNVKFGSLILTGGTSNVLELRQIMEDDKLFSRFEKEGDPSGCVGNGLALTISGEELERFEKAVRSDPELEMEKRALILDFSEVMDRYVTKHIIAKADEYIAADKQCTIAVFGEAVSKAVSMDEEMLKEIGVKVQDCAGCCAEVIKQYVDEHTPDYFSGRVPVTVSNVGDVSKNLNVISRNVVSSVMKKIDIRSVTAKVMNQATRWIGAALLWFIPFFGPELAADYWKKKGKKESVEKAKKKIMDKKQYERIKKAMGKEEMRQMNMSDAVQEAVDESTLFDDVVGPMVDAVVLRTTMTGFDVDIIG